MKLAGLCLLWTGFSEVEVEAFTGANDENVREAADSSWQRVASRSGMDSLYPLPLGPQWIAFEKPASTRALRLRITKAAQSRGIRIWPTR